MKWQKLWVDTKLCIFSGEEGTSASFWQNHSKDKPQHELTICLPTRLTNSLIEYINSFWWLIILLLHLFSLVWCRFLLIWTRVYYVYEAQLVSLLGSISINSSLISNPHVTLPLSPSRYLHWLVHQESEIISPLLHLWSVINIFEPIFKSRNFLLERRWKAFRNPYFLVKCCYLIKPNWYRCESKLFKKLVEVSQLGMRPKGTWTIFIPTCFDVRDLKNINSWLVICLEVQSSLQKED